MFVSRIIKASGVTLSTIWKGVFRAKTYSDYIQDARQSSVLQIYQILIYQIFRGMVLSMKFIVFLKNFFISYLFAWNYPRLGAIPHKKWGISGA